MSKNLSTVAAIEFDNEVKHAFQSAGRLGGTVTVRNNVVGDTYKFRNMGKGIAHERTAPSSDSIAMDVDHSFAVATLTNWDADEYTDIFDSKEVNFDEMRELSKVIASALGRRKDQTVINALDVFSGTKAGTVGTDIGGTGTGLNLTKLRKAKFYLDDQGVPSEGRYMAISAQGLEGLLGETAVTSSDYNNVKALVNGEVDTFLGFKFVTIETRAEGGLPKASTVRSGFAWHMDAVGIAIGIDITTGADWIAHKKSWLAHGEFKAGAVVRDGLGIVEVQYTES